MADTKIEWADSVWNPVVGCSIVSPGCTNCYAMKMAARIENIDAKKRLDRYGLAAAQFADYGAGGQRDEAVKLLEPHTHYAGLTRGSNAGAVWTGRVAQAPDRILTQPLRWRKPRRIFVNSMSDLFHESVPDEWIDRVFAVMALAPQHVFQVLTKRSKRMREYCTRLDNEPVRDTVRRIVSAWPGNAPIPAEITFPLLNVWLGVSAEDQPRADERIPDLLATPAAVRFVSAEPLLGGIDFSEIGKTDYEWTDALDGQRWVMDEGSGDVLHATVAGCPPPLDWIIVGGESGPGARPMHPDWARSIRDQCASAGVPFFFKQWGEWSPDRMLENVAKRGCLMRATGERPRADDATVRAIASGKFDFTGFQHFSFVGKARAGRILDGVEHDALPVRT